MKRYEELHLIPVFRLISLKCKAAFRLIMGITAMPSDPFQQLVMSDNKGVTHGLMQITYIFAEMQAVFSE